MYIPAVGLPPSDNPQHVNAREQEREEIKNMLAIGRGYLDDLGISYPGATYVAQFMVETWGWQVYGSLFRSTAATFEKALLETLEVDLTQLELAVQRDRSLVPPDDDRGRTSCHLFRPYPITLNSLSSTILLTTSSLS